MAYKLRSLNQPGLEVSLAAPVRIGRAPGNELQLNDPKVDERHAEIHLETGLLVVNDLQSMGGTFINHVSLPHAYLKPGDLLRFGDQEFVVEVESGRKRKPARLTRDGGTEKSRSVDWFGIGLVALVAALGIYLVLFGMPSFGSPGPATRTAAAGQTAAVLTASALPIATETGTPLPGPLLTAEALRNASCRSGPGTSFQLIVIFEPGSQAEVTGLSETEGAWYRLKLGQGITCWVSGELLTLSGDQAAVPLITPAPTPSPIPPADRWSGTWLVWYNPCNDQMPDCEVATTLYLTRNSTTVVSGYANAAGCAQSITLVLSTDGQTATGTFSSSDCAFSYPLRLFLGSSLTQFRGNFNGQLAYCGARSGAGKPYPCRQ